MLAGPRRSDAIVCALMRAALALLLLALVAATAEAQALSEPADPRACAAITTDAERLACYDLAFGREPAPVEPSPRSRSLLDSRWELFPESKLGTFSMRAYQPVYIFPWVQADRVNQFPSSPAPEHTVTESEDLDSSEVEFQLSLKTKAWQGVFGETGDLWLGYTQSSRWQLYNGGRSRPFRETNYEPEILLVFATRYRLFGWDARLLSFGLNHESNGRDNPRSRSWNRVTASVGLERDGWTLTVRPWWRIPEGEAEDDNPDLEDFVGRGDVLLVRHVRNHELAFLVRHSLRDGERSRGAAQVDWAFPIRGNLRAHVQLFHGYGESLIDYNFRTTRLGIGLSLIEWY
jgi:phospholipase A1/A2